MPSWGWRLAFDKLVLISGTPNLLEPCPETCAFYYHPNVRTTPSPYATEIAAQADDMAQVLERCLFIANDASERCGVRRKDHANMSKLHPFDSPRSRRGRYAS